MGLGDVVREGFSIVPVLYKSMEYSFLELMTYTLRKELRGCLK